MTALSPITPAPSRTLPADPILRARRVIEIGKIAAEGAMQGFQHIDAAPNAASRLARIEQQASYIVDELRHALALIEEAQAIAAEHGEAMLAMQIAGGRA